MNLFKLVFFICMLHSSINHAQGLENYKWKKRLILLTDSNKKFENAKSAFNILNAQTSKIKDRDILIFYLIENKVFNYAGKKVCNTSLINLSKDYMGYVLIGKDGGVKLKGKYPVKPDTIFDLIDSMPMRRAELKN